MGVRDAHPGMYRCHHQLVVPLEPLGSDDEEQDQLEEELSVRNYFKGRCVIGYVCKNDSMSILLLSLNQDIH